MASLKQIFDSSDGTESFDKTYQTEELLLRNNYLRNILRNDENLVGLYESAGLIRDYDYDKMIKDLNLDDNDGILDNFSRTADFEKISIIDRIADIFPRILK